jgi:hypothetical protein
MEIGVILLDAKKISTEYGIPKDTAYTIMRKVGAIDLTGDGVRKIYVRRNDLERWLEERKVAP